MQCRHSENDEATCVGFVVSKKIPDTASLAQEYARHTTKADLELAIKKVAERVRES